MASAMMRRVHFGDRPRREAGGRSGANAAHSTSLWSGGSVEHGEPRSEYAGSMREITVW